MYTVDMKSEAVSKALERLAAGLDDTTPVMQDIGEYLVQKTKERFPAGKAPDGSAWAAKSKVTIARYLAQGDKADPRPLFGPSGQLSSTIHYEAGRSQVRIGSALIYAAIMQFGAGQGEFGAQAGRTKPSAKRKKSQDYFFQIPWGNIPARPFLGLAESDGKDIVEIVEEYLTGLVTP